MSKDFPVPRPPKKIPVLFPLPLFLGGKRIDKEIGLGYC